MGKYFINLFIALRLKSGGSKGGWHYPLDKYILLHVKEPDIVFIHEFSIPNRERASLRVSERYDFKNE